MRRVSYLFDDKMNHNAVLTNMEEHLARSLVQIAGLFPPPPPLRWLTLLSASWGLGGSCSYHRCPPVASSLHVAIIPHDVKKAGKDSVDQNVPFCICERKMFETLAR